MKECIFWDSEDIKFINWEEVSFTKDKGDDFVVVMKEIDPICSEGRLYDSFDYIGLKDINNNKIYADCSIVEFNYTPEHAISFGGMEINEDYKIKGFFSYNSEELGYKIIILEGGLMFDSFIMNYSNKISNIKIIDTIQENKLGLMD